MNTVQRIVKNTEIERKDKALKRQKWVKGDEYKNEEVYVTYHGLRRY